MFYSGFPYGIQLFFIHRTEYPEIFACHRLGTLVPYYDSTIDIVPIGPYHYGLCAGESVLLTMLAG